MSAVQWAIIVIGLLLALTLLGAVAQAIRTGPAGPADPGRNALVIAGRIYCRLLHNLRVRGLKHIPRDLAPGPLVIVANHTAGVDPVLVQASCPFFIRWVMAEDMRAPLLEWYWRWWEVIFVDRTAHRAHGFRDAIRHIRHGGVVGIFPEGGIERPPGQLMPFQRGLGALLRVKNVRILPVTIAGTPQVDPAWSSLWRGSASVIHFREIITPEPHSDPSQIIADLERRFLHWTGWKLNENPPPGDATEREPAPANAGYYGTPVRF
ncbi:MAG: lysophospholipid acyltransferase family protein [Planctomycetota bacterium]